MIRVEIVSSIDFRTNEDLQLFLNQTNIAKDNPKLVSDIRESWGAKKPIIAKIEPPQYSFSSYESVYVSETQ